MKPFLIGFFIFLSAVMTVNSLFAGSKETIPLLAFKLPVPEGQIQKEYLGLSGQDVFSLNQIDTHILIIEIFSMYCPICQREATDVNAVFNLIQSDAMLKNRVKLIGIGAGNTRFEVNFFKETYDIQFPLFSDGDFAIHKLINEVRTPHFFGLKIDQNKDIDIFYSHTGEISDPKDFLDSLINQSKTGVSK